MCALVAAPEERPTEQWNHYIVALAASGILMHFVLRYVVETPRAIWLAPLGVTITFGGTPLLWELSRKVFRGNLGSDLLAGISIVTACVLGDYLVAAIVILMLSGGTALEQTATQRASSALQALAARMPQEAHRVSGSVLVDVALSEINPGDRLVVLPHEICPVDGTIIEGHGSMDESYLTGEPFQISKAPGACVLSGAVNGKTALTLEATKRPTDSRYARIVRVMHETELHRPHMRRLGDRLGTWYTPIAVLIAAIGWGVSGDPTRFLAVIVIATPCPLLIAIPVAFIGAVSLAARHGIVIRNPGALEQISNCHTLIFDKTGTLTRGRPVLTEILCTPEFSRTSVLRATASVEQYSRHPLSAAVLEAAEHEGLSIDPVNEVTESPGKGLTGIVDGQTVHITGRNALGNVDLPPVAEGLECIVLIDERIAATLRFRDEPRPDSKRFIRHLGERHRARRLILLSGDRESEARHIAVRLGIQIAYGNQSPEQKVEIVRQETLAAQTIFVGDGINDAPAMLAASVGVAFGPNSDITAEAADAVILDGSLAKVDELIHIGRRMRSIALQSAVGGMVLSFIGMIAAVSGFLPPIGGAAAQEVIDIAAVLNAVRIALPSKNLSDY